MNTTADVAVMFEFIGTRKRPIHNGYDASIDLAIGIGLIAVSYFCSPVVGFAVTMAVGLAFDYVIFPNGLNGRDTVKSFVQ